MKKIIFSIFLLLSLIVKSQTLSIESSLDMIFTEDSVQLVNEDGLYVISEYDTIRDRVKSAIFDNISFKLVNQSYFNSADYRISDLDGEYSDNILLISASSEYGDTYSQIISIDQILALKIIIDQVYKFRKSKNFNYSFGEGTFGKPGINGNFSNGELYINFFNINNMIGEVEYDFISNLSKVTELGEPSLLRIESIDIDQIKSLRKFLNKALK
tara:strand:- start:3 stop:644 length:642 start_codon:yes stop_codon:yes gene_type:complete